MMDSAWEDLSRTLRSSAPYKSLLQGLGDVVRLPVPAAAWVGELLARDLKRPLLVVVPREADALTWMEAARLFGREDGAVYFPAPSLTPYQETESSLQVRAQESVALDCVTSGRAVTIVTTPRALFRRLPAPEAFRRAVLAVKPGEDHAIESLTRHLARYGYKRTDLVYEVGDFAVRGGIVDVFPPGEFPGWENYHPLLAAKTVALTEALTGGLASPLTWAIDPPALEAEVAHHAERLEGDYAARVEHGRLAVPPEALEQPAQQVRE